MDLNLSYKNLIRATYYSLIALVVAVTGLFLWRMTSAGINVAVQVIYYIWSAFLIVVAIYDIYCSMMKSNKKGIGYCLFIISWLAIIMAIVLFFVLELHMNLTLDNEMLYAGLICLNFIPAILAIVAYCLGFKYHSGAERDHRTVTNHTV